MMQNYDKMIEENVLKVFSEMERECPPRTW